MIYTLKISTKFNKNFKRYKHDHYICGKVEKLLALLSVSGEAPSNYRPHGLVGNFDGYIECHIKPDLLLVYTLPDENGMIYLADIGSHNQIFD